MNVKAEIDTVRFRAFKMNSRKVSKQGTRNLLRTKFQIEFIVFVSHLLLKFCDLTALPDCKLAKGMGRKKQ